jgi:hypothetical protein
MTINFPLSLPTSLAPKRVDFRAITQNAIVRSIFTGRSQTFENSLEMLSVSVTLPSVDRTTHPEIVSEWLSFFLKLRGQLGTFTMADHTYAGHRGVVSGTPVVDGSDEAGKSFHVRGLTSSIANQFRAGDQIQIGNNLHIILTDASSDGSGKLVLDIFPRIYSVPADGATIITSSPKGLFRLPNNDMMIASANEAKIFDFSFEAIGEVF